MKQLKILGILFSVALNVVLIAGRLYAWRTTSHKEKRQLPPRALLKQLNLHPDQLKRFTAGCRPFKESIRKQGERMRTKRMDLLDLLANRPSDQAAIQAVVRDIQVLQHEMQAKVVHHLIEESRIFTPEQRTRFFALLKERMRTRRLSRPSWMPRSH